MFNGNKTKGKQMDNAREITLAILEDLINICKEEYSLFKSASSRISDPYLKSTLENCVEEKNRNIRKLETEVERLGGKFESMSEQLSPYLVEEINSFNDDKEILSKCEQIDDIVLSRYSNAMNGDILWEVVPLVAKQYFSSVNLHCRIIYSFKNDLPTSIYS
jgi:uncharacterized protein (TIGR02284 family)